MRAFFRVLGEICSHPAAAARDPFLRILVAAILVVAIALVVVAS